MSDYIEARFGFGAALISTICLEHGGWTEIVPGSLRLGPTKFRCTELVTGAQIAGWVTQIVAIRAELRPEKPKPRKAKSKAKT
jgi:hypothetical protein